MEHDDRLIGRVLSRRDVFALLAAGGAAAAVWPRASLGAWQAAAGPLEVPACVVRPELEQGPFFVDLQLDRSDIRSEPATGVVSPGAPLAIGFSLSQIAAGRCAPLSGAIVDVWHCDALGIYSGVSGPGQASQAAGGKALRGFQRTDAQGQARFVTVYPGWYQGRAVHVHLKVRVAAPTGAYEFTSQVFFDDALTDQVHAQAPYAAHGRRDTLNSTDGIFRSGGAQMVLAPVKQGERLVANFAIGLDLSDAAVARPDGGGGRGPGPGGPGRGRGRGRG